MGAASAVRQTALALFLKTLKPFVGGLATDPKPSTMLTELVFPNTAKEMNSVRKKWSNFPSRA
jgi:hypothetical protein